MGRKGTREKSADVKSAAAAVAETEADLSPIKNKKDKKDKKETKEKKEKKEKKGKSETPPKDETKTYEEVFDDSSDAEDEPVRGPASANYKEAFLPISNDGDLLSWRLPGALSPFVDNKNAALLEAGLFAVTSTILSRVVRYGVSYHAIRTPSFMDSTGWDYLLRVSSVQGYGALAASIFAKAQKHVVGWNDIYALSALNVLVSAPMVYLLSMFYKVPLSATLLSESLEIASDLLPVLAYRKWIRPSAPTDKTNDKAKTGLLAAVHDPISRVLLIMLSAVLYNFIFVQACRAYLPEALVLHFPGIATIEPARAFSMTWSSFFSQKSVVFALFQSPSIVTTSTVCAYAAWVYIVERLDNPTGTEGSYVLKPIVMRALAASGTVGLGVYVRCLMGVYGVDATGAALYNMPWALSPVLVGSLVGYIIAF